MKKFLLTLLCTSLFSSVAFAEATPKGTRYDNRIKTVTYNPDNVTRVNVTTGIATLIQFSSNEYIDDVVGGVGLGDSAAWAVNVKNNNVWIKPIAEEPDTNLVIVTNKRTYQFSLVSVKNRNSAAWTVRFTYPENNKTAIYTRPCQGGTSNYRYWAQGDKAIAPVEVWDNGIFTCFRFATGTEMPVIFKVLPDGKEGLVNSNIDSEGVVIVHEISKAFKLRLGDLVTGIKTDKLRAITTNNGTTNGKTREVIND